MTILSKRDYNSTYSIEDAKNLVIAWLNLARTSIRI